MSESTGGEAPKEEKKIGRKARKNSYASVIAKVLGTKSVKNIEDAVAKVDEEKPGRDKAKNESQIRTIIREAKKGKGRWKNYIWDDEAFQLTKKEKEWQAEGREKNYLS